MSKYIFLILAFSSVIFAIERPEWYPENATEIENKCKEQYSITAENLDDVRKLKLTDTPTMRSLAFCAATGKNVYRPGKGFEPERFSSALKYAVKLDCNLEEIHNCAEKHKDLEPEEFMFFSTVKCVFDNAKDNCKKID